MTISRLCIFYRYIFVDSIYKIKILLLYNILSNYRLNLSTKLIGSDYWVLFSFDN